MGQEILKGKWLEIKGEIRKTWGEITGDELEKTKGDMEAIAGLLAQKYGIAKKDAQEKVSSIINSLEKSVSKKTEAIKRGLR